MRTCKFFSPSSNERAQNPELQMAEDYPFDRPLPMSHCGEPHIGAGSLTPTCIAATDPSTCPYSVIEPTTVLSQTELSGDKERSLRLVRERHLFGQVIYGVQLGMAIGPTTHYVTVDSAVVEPGTQAEALMRQAYTTRLETFEGFEAIDMTPSADPETVESYIAQVVTA